MSDSHFNWVADHFDGFDGKNKALCPAHNDKNPSLSLSQGDGGHVLLNCLAGCKTKDVLKEVGLELADLMPQDIYEYRDAENKLLKQVIRKKGKKFSQRRPDGKGGWISDTKNVRHTLYKLPELLASGRQRVFITEGEKDADNLTQLGCIATTNSGGASSKWHPEYSKSLRGRHVVILPDNDKPGKDRANRISKKLSGIAKSIRIVELPDLPKKGDVTDWIEAGGTKRDLIRIVTSKKPLQKKGEPADRTESCGLHTVRMSEVESRPVEWLWDQRFPRGKIVLLNGDPDLGKGWVCVDLIARVTTHREMPDGSKNPFDGPKECLWFSSEDGNEDTFKPRLEAMRADPELVHSYSFVKDDDENKSSFGIKEHIDHLDAFLADHPEVVLVVFDPIASFIGAVDTHKDASVRTALGPLKELCETHNVTALGINHLNKSDGTNALYRSQGSMAFVAAARSSYFVSRCPDEPEDGRLFTEVKNNLKSERLDGLKYYVGKEHGGIKWDGTVRMRADDVLQAAAKKESKPSVREEAKQLILAELSVGPKPASYMFELADAVCISKRTMNTSKKELSVESERTDGIWVWKLPDPEKHEQDRRNADAMKARKEGCT